MTKDMTNGSPLKLIIAFCLPLVFGNFFQQFYNMVDTIIVGKFVGVNALAGVGSTGSIQFMVLGFAIGVCSGFSINIAQSFGAGDTKLMRKYIANSAYLSVAVTLVLTAVTVTFTKPILRIMQTPDEIFNDAYNYIIVIFIGIFATMFYNILSGILRALGDSKTPLIFLIISSVINVVLDLAFILKFNMGVMGAGVATVLAQAISGFLCLLYMKRKFEVLHFEKDELTLDGRCCKRLLAIGLPMALQFSITAIGSIILQTAVNSLGAGIIAAVTAAGKIQLMVTQPMETLGITMATYCGQNLGARKFERIKKGIRQSSILSVCYCILACMFVSFLGQYIALWFLDSKETQIISDTVYFLRINAIFYPVLGFLFIFRNSLQGMGYSFLPMMAGVSELVARALVSFGFVSIFGFNAVCLASPVAWIFADALLLTTYFIKMKQLKVQLEHHEVTEPDENVVRA